VNYLPKIEIQAPAGPKRPFGLLSHIKWLGESDEANSDLPLGWEGGTQWRSTTQDLTGDQLRVNVETGCAASTLTADPIASYIDDFDPFLLYTRRSCSTPPSKSMTSTLESVFEDAYESYLEKALWDQIVASSDVTITEASTPTTGVTAEATLSLLEDMYAEATGGRLPFLLIRRSLYPLFKDLLVQEGDKLFTIGGTPVVLGPLFGGTFPGGGAATTDYPVFAVAQPFGFRSGSEVSTDFKRDENTHFVTVMQTFFLGIAGAEVASIAVTTD